MTTAVHASAGGYPPEAMIKSDGIAVVHGTGGHSKVVCEAIRARNLARKTSMKFRFTDDAEGTAPESGELFIVAIGDNRVRQRMDGQMSVYHPTAMIAATVRIGNGTFVAANVTISEGAKLGRGVIANTGCLIDHDVVVGDFAHIAPGAVLLGGVQIGEGVLIGANATIKQGLTVGDWAVVGMGAVVLKNVDMDAVVVGNPARLLQGA